MASPKDIFGGGKSGLKPIRPKPGKRAATSFSKDGFVWEEAPGHIRPYRENTVTSGGKKPPKPAPIKRVFTYKDPVFSANAADFYGLTIPVSAGKRAVTGVPIWASPMRTNGIEHYVSFAVSFGAPMVPDDELEDVFLERLWMNGKLVYNADTDTGWTTGQDIQFQIYNGSITQMADPKISDWLEQAGHTPIAFRGRIYVVFYDFPLHKYGWNVIPFVRAELRDVFGERANVKETAVLSTPGIDISNRWIAVNWDKMRAYVLDRNGLAPNDNDETHIRTIDLSNNVEINRQPILDENGIPFDPLGAGPLVEGHHGWYVDPYYGYVITSRANAGAKVPMLAVNPDTGLAKQWGEFSSISGSNTSSGFQQMRHASAMRINGVEMQQVFIQQVGFFGDSLSNEIGITSLSESGDSEYVWHADDPATANTVYSDFDTLVGEVLQTAPGDLIEGVEAATGFIMTNRAVYRLVVGRAVDLSWQVRFDHLYTFPDGHLLHRIHQYGDAIIVFHTSTLDSDYYCSRLDLVDEIRGLPDPVPGTTGDLATLTWTTEPLPGDWNTNPAVEHDFLNGGEYANLNGTGTVAYVDRSAQVVVVLKLSTGQFSSYDFSEWKFYDETTNEPQDIEINTHYVWNAEGNYFIGIGGASFEQFTWSKIWPTTPPGVDVSLGQIVRWMMLYNDYTDDQIDVQDIDDVVTGSLVQEINISLWEVLDQMGAVFRFDRFESENTVKFIKQLRGASLTITVTLDPENDLCPLSGGEVADGDDPAFVTERDWNEDIPGTVELQYLDETSEYIVNIARAKRTQFPVKTVQNTGVEEYAVPIVMTPAEALGYASKALYDLYEGITTHNFRVSKRHLTLEPGDVVALTINDIDYLMKISEATINGDDSQSIVAKGFSNLDLLDITGETPIADPQVIPSPSVSELYILDTPPLAPQDALTVPFLQLPVLITSIGQSGWRGGVLYTSDSTTGPWDDVAEQDQEGAVVGIATNLLPHHPGGSTDFENTLLVRLLVGRSIGLPATGSLLVGRQGRWEHVTYGAIVDNGDGSYDVTEIVRGVRGTEWATHLHQAGDSVILISASEPLIERLTYNVARLGDSLYARCVGLGQDLSSVLPRTLTINGNYAKPFAPIGLKATLDGSDIDLEWTRRTRLESHLGDGGTTPLEFDDEEYELEIMNAAGTTVLRTVTGLTSPAYTYAAADITTDFGSTPDSLTFRVYQISPTVGRGFVGEDTVDVL